MSEAVATAHLERAVQRIESAIATKSAPERMGFAELAKGDIAAAVKETRTDQTSPGGGRKEKASKEQKSLPFTPKGDGKHTVDESGVVVDLHPGSTDEAERHTVGEDLPTEAEYDAAHQDDVTE
jgi:hypothetical protein